MPSSKDAAWWRDYRAKKKGETLPGALPNVETKVCGCQPGNLCIPHAGAAMSQHDRDRILDRIPRTARR